VAEPESENRLAGYRYRLPRTTRDHRHHGALTTNGAHEADYIRWVLQQTKGNRTCAAGILGIDRVSLWRKLKKHEIDVWDATRTHRLSIACRVRRLLIGCLAAD
jgi:DNA-binding NtrC family response regulator